MGSDVKERDLVVPALQVALSMGGEVTTTELIAALEKVFQPTGHDAEILNRRNDSHFSQKVRNLVSHRQSPTSMFYKRYAVYHRDRESIQITAKGEEFLKSQT